MREQDVYDLSIDFDLEERTDLQQAIAAGLASLSTSTDAPAEVEMASEFSASDVRFEQGLWLDQIVQVQDWLRLSRPLDAFADNAVLVAQLFDGLAVDNPSEAFLVTGDQVTLTGIGLDLLRDRIDRAVLLRDTFLEALESGTRTSATAAWVVAWDDTVDETVSGPIMAKAGIWSIHDFASRAKSRRLDLSPSYQRGDVWPTRDAQLLIESILRGIPLPSVIILRPKTLGEAPYEVVDGKQRLTSILRFIGAHPTAIENVERANQEHPGFELNQLFRDDYPRFRTAWKDATGETLTSTRERELYFPYKLGSASAGLSGELTRLAGRYYHSIRDEVVRVGGEQVEVREIFESTTDYKVPVIEYTEASPRQIHEVFSLYNKQGKHLNAEEIRNAVYHELDLMRALAAAAGDGPPLDVAAPFLLPAQGTIDQISAGLVDYGVSDARYRRTKILSWLFSMIFVESVNDDDEPRRLSTAQQINNLLDRTQTPGDPMRDRKRIVDALSLVSIAMEAHLAADAWADSFKDGKNGDRWQDLQLIASLLGVTLAAAALGDQVGARLESVAADLRHLTGEVWLRPKKTQTSIQWQYIAQVAIGIVRTLGVSPDEVDSALRDGYVFSSVRALGIVADA